MGTGKTLLSLQLLQYWWDCGLLRRTLVFVTSDKAFRTWLGQAREYGITVPTTALTGSSEQRWQQLEEFGDGIAVVPYPGALYMCASKVKKKRGKGNELKLDPEKVARMLKWAQGFVLDECFPRGTLVLGENGEVAIEQLRPGDLVQTSAGLRRVRQLMRKETQHIVELSLSTGQRLVCTPNHPFFTELGWVCAGNLKGRQLYGAADVLQLWESVQGNTPQQILRVCLLSEISNWEAPGSGCNLRNLWDGLSTEKSWASFLLACMRRAVPTWASFLESRYSNAGRDAPKIKQDPASDETPSSCGSARWKWTASDAGTADSACRIRPAMDTGASHFIGAQAAWISNLLQGRLSEPEKAMGYRAGWGDPQWAYCPTTGRQKRQQASGTWVESVAHKELGSPIPVFSLEIEECPHFYAGGYLVHNSTKATGDSLTFDLIAKLRKVAKVRYALAGRPFGRDPIMLWAQHYLIDDGETLGTTRGMFREVFYNATKNRFGGPFSMDYSFKQSMRPVLADMIQHRSITYGENECVDIPKVQPITELLPLPQEAEAYWDRLLKDLIAARGDFRMSKNIFLRMRQISSGFLGFHNDETGEKAEIEFAQNPKLDRLLELVDEVPEGHGAVIFYEFTHSGRRIVRELEERGYDPVWLWSGTKDPDAEFERFENSKQPVCVLNNRVGAYSLDGLQKIANYDIEYEAPVSVIDWEQARKRLARQGQLRRVFQYSLLVAGTADEKIRAFHREGQELFQALLRDPERALR